MPPAGLARAGSLSTPPGFVVRAGRAERWRRFLQALHQARYRVQLPQDAGYAVGVQRVRQPLGIAFGSVFGQYDGKAVDQFGGHRQHLRRGVTRDWV